MGYFISDRFLDKVAIHLAKNFLDIPNVSVPLILGIHGRKGEGKSFQCGLVFQRLGVEVVRVSGGELESPDAGDPARLLRLRYREAAELVRVRGRMAVLAIDDLDAGAGRMDRFTQYTVNTQLVNATLMNIADHPTNVQLPGSYDAEPIRRVPIVVTGNDFGTLYAPLTRDGRMEKFYWQPTAAERLEIVGGMFADTGIDRPDVAALIGAFPEQAIDFFGAIKSRAYDAQVRDLIASMGVEQISKRLATNPAAASLGRPDFRLETLRAIGTELLAEQQHIQELHLAQQYNPHHAPSDAADSAAAGSSAAGSDGAANGVASGWASSTHLDHSPQPPAPAIRSPLGDWNGEGRSPQGNGTPTPPPSTNQRADRAFRHTQTVTSGNNGGKSDTNRSTHLVLAPPPPESLYRHGRFLAAPAEPAPSPAPPLPTADAAPLPAAVRSPLDSLLAQGCRVGIEFANPRQFRANAWRCWSTVDPEPADMAIAQVAACLATHPHAYIRLVAIDPHRKQRLREIIIQRP